MQVLGDFDTVRPRVVEVTHEDEPRVVFDVTMLAPEGAPEGPPYAIYRAWHLDEL